MASLHHGAIDTDFEELVLALKPYASLFCRPMTWLELHLELVNLALFSTMVAFTLYGLLKYCHY